MAGMQETDLSLHSGRVFFEYRAQFYGKIVYRLIAHVNDFVGFHEPSGKTRELMVTGFYSLERKIALRVCSGSSGADLDQNFANWFA